ncbi:uncharacterized protein LOC109537069 [Dendroctonus ponderosae]|uniref:F-box domain-containing protein n=1 Tax=Dendroctonus ponderosae TaxID=77166 RepID=A0AAR5PEL5_DENPD|nr:uncharacterized protein LOC109537069 [Dendroctonus ponderosae]KAH1011458.1 hypothetical protein HUJ04_000824 [Dendroctonus ponderosae]KAH1018640.1 hypothetical protein HUJ05_006369 [Dendroctonus ponderosae]
MCLKIKVKTQPFPRLMFFLLQIMSPKKPVENLRDLCLKVIIVLILDAIKCCGENCADTLTEYFSELPKCLQERILLDILQLSPLNSFSKWVSFRIFQYKCATFSSKSISAKFHEKFAEKLEKLRYLNVAGAEIGEKTLRGIIRKSPSLRTLIIPDFASDEVLEEVKNLENLELLDISGHCDVTHKGLSYISSKSLQVLVIGTVQNFENLDVLAEILPRLPNLKEVRSYEYTGRSLLNLNTPFISRLRAISDFDTTIEQIRVIIAVCPQLELLSLEDPVEEVFEYLGELMKLKKLALSQYHGHLTNINLKQLKLLSLELKHLAINFNALCCTLEALQMRSCHIQISSLEALCFRNLASFEAIDCNLKKDLVLQLLQHCDRLRRLAISNDVDLSDLDIKQACQEDKLQHLEEFWLSVARGLTSNSVIILMSHCPKLVSLGTLNGWNIDKVEVNYLRCVTYFTNTNLNLLYFSCF